MPLFLDKALPLFVYPIGLTILAGIAALILSVGGYGRTSRAVLSLGIAVLWISSAPIFSHWLYGKLEARYPAVAIAALPAADVAIVLGGSVGRPVAPRLAPDAGDPIDRVLHAARLFHADKVKAILVSGGNLPWQTGSIPEAELVRDLLVELGVPRGAIVLEPDSKNTRQNAINSAAIINENNWRSALLVTSAAHMPRALAVFKRVGIEAAPVSTDVRVTHPLFESALDLLPNAAALALTTDALKELLGMWVYRLRGWV